MNRTRISAVALAVLAVAVPLAGCGGDDDADQFRDDYNSLNEDLRKVNDDLGSANASDPEQLAKQFDKIADQAGEARDKLADLDPPDDAQEELDNLVKAVDSGTDDIRGVAEAARKGDQQGLVDAANQLSQAGQRINQAEEELKKAVDE